MIVIQSSIFISTPPSLQILCLVLFSTRLHGTQSSSGNMYKSDQTLARAKLESKSLVGTSVVLWFCTGVASPKWCVRKSERGSFVTLSRFEEAALRQRVLGGAQGPQRLSDKWCKILRSRHFLALNIMTKSPTFSTKNQAFDHRHLKFYQSFAKNR